MKVSGNEKNTPLILWPTLDFSSAFRYLFDIPFVLMTLTSNIPNIKRLRFIIHLYGTLPASLKCHVKTA